MAHDQDAGFHNGLDLGHHPDTAFEFNGIAAGFFQKAASVFNRFFQGALIGHKRHIAYNKSIGSTAAHRFAMIDALVHDHRHRSGIAINAHPQRIPNQQHVQAGSFGKLCGGKIIGGQKRDFFAVLFHSQKIMNHFFLCHLEPPLTDGCDRLKPFTICRSLGFDFGIQSIEVQS